MPKIIDIPYGTYLGQVVDISAIKINDKDYVQLQTEILVNNCAGDVVCDITSHELTQVWWRFRNKYERLNTEPCKCQ